MKPRTIRHFVAILLGISLTACANLQTPAHRTSSLFNRLAHGQLEAATVDFRATRNLAGANELDSLRTRIAALATADNEPCAAERLNALEALPWIDLAIQSDDRQLSEQARASLLARLDELDQTISNLTAGREVNEPRLGSAAAVVAFERNSLAAAVDDRDRELHRRVIAEQVYRVAGTQWREGLPAPAAGQWWPSVTAKIWRAGCDNTRWLRAQIAEIDWFTIHTYGEQSDAAAWLLVQHSDFDRPLQRDVLARLERLAPSGGTAGRNVANLYDRLAVADGRPQHYGTQVRCANGSWEIIGGVEDSGNLDAARRSMGLGDWAQYVGQFGNCPSA